MTIKNKKTSFIVLDLDDTIYKEKNFVKSGFAAIVKKYADHHHYELLEMMMNSWINGENAINSLFELLNISNIPIQEPLDIYHNHFPEIRLPFESKSFFHTAISRGYKLGLITDGHKITQRNKLKALGINRYFDKIVISEEFGSEKPNIQNYKIFEDIFPDNNFCYIGDNTKKDFIAPTKLGWQMYCIRDNGNNIHKQDFSTIPPEVILLENINQFFNEK
jgi:putative hydrolase of the HAD superfamily